MGSGTKNILVLHGVSNWGCAAGASDGNRWCPGAELGEDSMGVVLEMRGGMEVAKEPIVDVGGAALVLVLFADVQHEALEG